MGNQTATKNPIRRYKLRHGLTYQQLAQALGISSDYARKLGAGLYRRVSVTRALEIEERTQGEIRFGALMRWAREEGRDGESDSEG